MDRSPQRTRAGSASGSPANRKPPGAWLAALVVLLVVSSVTVWPVYRDRLRTSWSQTRLLPRRLDSSLDEMNLQVVGAPYRILRAVRARTFDDAVILISSDRRDAPLNNILWCAFYLYPRVLVQQSALASRPGLEPDFQITTSHFGGNPSEGTAAAKPGLRALSARAQNYAKAHWKP